MSLSINNKTIKSLMKDNKEIVKIERAVDGKILYQKESNNNYVVATFTGNNARLGYGSPWLETTGDVIIDWGDGSTDTVNNPFTRLSHTYSDGLNEHLIIFGGAVTSLGGWCFYNCSGLTSIIIPDSVTSIGDRCFYGCSGLTSVTIPSSVTSLGGWCFYNCSGLIDYQLYWAGNDIITYDSSKMPNNTNSIFTIPIGETNNYVAKNYPSNKLVERGTHTYSLSIASDKQSILTSESVTISGTLLMDSSGYSGQSVALYDGSTLIDTLTTDSNGNYSKTISGLTAGTHTFKAVNTNAESSTVTVTVSEPTPVHNYSITITGDSIIQTGDTDNITATLKDNGVVVSGETLNYQIKHGSTVIDSGTDTTGSNGQITISYTGTGAGDVDVIVSYGSLLQETYEIEDCLYFNDGTKTTGITYPSTVSVTSENGALKISGGTTNSERQIFYPTQLTSSTNFEYEIETVTGGVFNPITAIVRASTTAEGVWVAYHNSNLEYYGGMHNQTFNKYYPSFVSGDKLRIIRKDGTTSIYLNDTLIKSNSGNLSGTFQVGHYTNANRIQYVKNIKIKAL